AVFGAAARATFALIVFAFEITRNYDSVLPLMLTCVIADMIAIRFLPSSIMTEKLTRRGLTVPTDFEVGVLQVVKVSEVMRTDVPTIPAEMTVGELAERMGRGEPGFNMTQGLPICDADGKLAGIVTQGDLLRALKLDPSGNIKVLDAGSQSLIVAYPDERAFDALYRMLNNNIGRLPVVSRDGSKKLVGYLNRSSILSAWTRQIEDESLREHGWLDAILRTSEYQRSARHRILVGKIAELTQTKIELDVTTEGKVQRFELKLAAPQPGIAVGDVVKVSFLEENDSRPENRIVQRIEEIRAR
ncbi:MAG TPA: CBS domain-containing protein, partial [Candidatus Dormibacteraeota bacterium]|nr:CBS domain-containing protein [Candidatus Dormibacteraeota bacterium]